MQHKCVWTCHAWLLLILSKPADGQQSTRQARHGVELVDNDLLCLTTSASALIRIEYQEEQSFLPIGQHPTRLHNRGKPSGTPTTKEAPCTPPLMRDGHACTSADECTTAELASHPTCAEHLSRPEQQKRGWCTCATSRPTSQAPTVTSSLAKRCSMCALAARYLRHMGPHLHAVSAMLGSFVCCFISIEPEIR